MEQTQPLKFTAWYRDIATNELDCKTEDEMMDIYVAYCMSFSKPQHTEILSPEAWIAETTKNGDLREVEMLMQQYSDYVLSMQNPQITNSNIMQIALAQYKASGNPSK